MSLVISVMPQIELIDVPRRIVIRGLEAGAEVQLTARSRRTGGSVWQARAVFLADAEGIVDVTRDAPVSGSYSGISAMGLIWSQEEVSRPTGPQSGAAGVEPVVTELLAQSAGGRAQGSMTQIFAAEGVAREDVQRDGVCGVLYRPAGPGPHPAVIVMNGSGGGVNEPRAALYASRGYLALALGYFRFAGRPDWINETPLEYFRDAISWLRRSEKPKDGFVAITGQSRGGELVMLLAATFPELVSAVMAYVPASCIHSAQSAGDPARGRLAPTWTLDGKPLPHLWENNRTGTYAPYDSGAEPRRHEYALLTAMADAAAVERARIPVERITAPVLLVHGTDDGWWPTDYHCDVMEESLRAAGRHVERLRYEEAGHIIVFPYIPTTGITAPHPVSGIFSTNGGTAEADARANAESWPAVLDFLERCQKKCA
ncbi:acyl-CoA thioesterase/bile acid-CoA:amino acid N-acyltransferase family protein [Mesorhizobium sp. 1B3]|uniref:acyl-CoA thioesterase/bile acid-CoA:amino acid N-acyltransferase family protein n=1 Tax=Mesorhizobium sp. 1B3 TaxID=3243599 RepID=UPI003D9814E5